ncbi:MAG: hypothetical protein DRR19_08935 [Candidatus Parabeggiatoa sp. nov. 1]|nr:MAG: hypothetical protein DRR19_08935 [Gammaproteobacteria bacterium]
MFAPKVLARFVNEKHLNCEGRRFLFVSPYRGRAKVPFDEKVGGRVTFSTRQKITYRRSEKYLGKTVKRFQNALRFITEIIYLKSYST